jgi:hypothetical protein
MGLFGGLFGKQKDPMKALMPYLQKAEGTMKDYLNPYVDIGMGAGDLLQNQYGQLVNDPAAMLEQFMSGYQQSPQYQMKSDQMLSAAGNTAAAGGRRGSPLDQRDQMQIAQALLGEDMQQYLGNVTGLYGTGLAGEQGLFDTGYGAASDLSGNLANLYGTAGSAAYQGARESNSNKQALLGALMGLGGGIAGFGSGGGSTIGGDMYKRFFGG